MYKFQFNWVFIANCSKNREFSIMLNNISKTHQIFTLKTAYLSNSKG